MKPTISPNTYCEACDQPIGETMQPNGAMLINDHVTCWDGISSKVVTFHKKCHERGLAGAGRPSIASDPNVQRNHHIGLAPGVLGLTLKGL